MPREAWLVCKGVRRNSIFDADANPDGIKDKWIALRERFASEGIDLTTPDRARGAPPLFELHLNVPSYRRGTGRPTYAVLAEAPQVYPLNGDSARLAPYRKIFTWDDARADGDRSIRIALGHRLAVHAVDGYAQRPLFCSMIAANKSVPRPCYNNLYRERVRLIRWFERNAPADFALYGPDWDLPARQPGLVGKIRHALAKRLRLGARSGIFPSWRGRVGRKSEVLEISRFAIAYENLCDLPGYVTEKIFDAFAAGCVPVYWGASNITDLIPADCYVDRRQFGDDADLYAYLRQMDEQRYRRHQEAMAAFLRSEAAQAFSVGTFAQTIGDAVLDDLRRQRLVL